MVAGLTVVLPIVKNGLKWKKCRCEGHPVPNVCVFTSVVGVPPINKWAEVLRRKKTVRQMFKEDRARQLQCLNEVVGNLNLEQKLQQTTQKAIEQKSK